MTKLTPPATPAMVPSAEERVADECSFTGPLSIMDKMSAVATLAYSDGFRDGIDAVIALLREPDHAIVDAIFDTSRPGAALADELERRKDRATPEMMES